MNNTIKELYKFQKLYLLKILENISEKELFLNQEKGINSPGWILGHLIVEVEDISKHLNIKTVPLPMHWNEMFRGGKPWKNFSSKELPKKEELIEVFIATYDSLLNVYTNLSDQQRKSIHPSKMLAQFYTNLDSWFSHHLITHLAVHSGNIAMWKKMNNIKVEGL